MGDKTLILELLEKADERQLRLLYCYLAALLGLG